MLSIRREEDRRVGSWRTWTEVQSRLGKGLSADRTPEPDRMLANQGCRRAQVPSIPCNRGIY